MADNHVEPVGLYKEALFVEKRLWKIWSDFAVWLGDQATIL